MFMRMVSRVLTFSFNGFPAIVTDCVKILHHEDKNKKLDRTIHAELRWTPALRQVAMRESCFYKRLRNRSSQ